MKYCCEAMRRSLLLGELKFYPRYRGICCYCKNNRDGGYDEKFLIYCPFCGVKLPKCLWYEYADEMEAVVGKYFGQISDDEIPEEFKTDKWWKKRGL